MKKICISLIITFVLNIYFAYASEFPLKDWASINLQYQINAKTISVSFPYSKDFNNDTVQLLYYPMNKPGFRSFYYTFKALYDVRIIKFEIKYHHKFTDNQKFFCNGYQSWSTSREYYPNERLQKLRPLIKPFAKQSSDHYFYNYSSKKGELHSWSFTYFTQPKNEVSFLASIDEHTGYTIFKVNANKNEVIISKDLQNLEVKKDKCFDIINLLFINSSQKEAFNIYAKEYYKKMFDYSNASFLDYSKTNLPQQRGWTSWYNYYTKIDLKIILDNLNAFKTNNVKADIFQIDDGYQYAVGDWAITNSKFPNGMKAVADSIHKAGYKAGIWLAPFICEKKSHLFQQHSEWLLRDKKGKPIKAGYNPNWSGYFYALDIYNPKFREYLTQVFDTIYNVWGFDMVKVDFIYAACLKTPTNKSRGETMYDASLLLRELSPKKQILGCGAPLAPVFHLFDFCRISSDVHLAWEFKALKSMHVRDRVSTWNALTSTIGRAFLSNNFFLNDPDVFIIRDENNKLTTTQKQTLFRINYLLGGLVFTSDNLAKYSDKTLKTFSEAYNQTPAKINHISMLAIDVYLINYEQNNKIINLFVNLSSKNIYISRKSDKTYSISNNKADMIPYFKLVAYECKDLLEE